MKPRRSAISIVTLRFSPPMSQSSWEIRESVDDLVCQIAAEGLANEAVAPFDLARDPLNSASICLRSEMSAQEPTSSFGLPSLSRMTVKVS